MASVAFFCIIVLIIGALIAYALNRAPFLEAGLKQIAVWAVIAVTILIIVLRLLTLV